MPRTAPPPPLLQMKSERHSQAPSSDHGQRGPSCPVGSKLEIHSYLPGGTTNKKKKDMTEKETADLRAHALEVIDNYNAELVTYTDVSCKAGTTDGGAAAFTTGPAAQPEVVETLREKGRKFTSSYEEEKAAMTIAANWLATNKAERKLICTDGQSLTQALSMTSPDILKVLECLNSIQGRASDHPMGPSPHRHPWQ